MRERTGRPGAVGWVLRSAPGLEAGVHGSPGTSAEGYPAAGVLGCQEPRSQNAAGASG